MQEETKGLEETKETAKDIMNDLMVEIIKHSRSTAIRDAIKVIKNFPAWELKREGDTMPADNISKKDTIKSLEELL